MKTYYIRVRDDSNNTIARAQQRRAFPNAERLYREEIERCRREQRLSPVSVELPTRKSYDARHTIGRYTVIFERKDT